LNWQTFDLAVQLNEALFISGGWILKPPSLRAEHGEVQPDEQKTRGGKVEMMLEIVGGSELPMPEDAKKQGTLQPYVVVELMTSKGDQKKKTEAYKNSKDDNSHGTNPVWNERLTFEWEDEEVVFVR
jgi:phosphatidylinositol phospholipase C delta